MKKILIVFVFVMFAIPAFAMPDGKADYKARCAGCHGAYGNVQTEKARVLKMDVRKLSLKASKKSRAEMLEIVEKGKGEMPAFKNDLSKEQISAIINYVLTFRRR